jgi:hypothetical protein
MLDKVLEGEAASLFCASRGMQVQIPLAFALGIG